jgi:hypothetical protein
MLVDLGDIGMAPTVGHFISGELGVRVHFLSFIGSECFLSVGVASFVGGF